jgi:hypothetical protein
VIGHNLEFDLLWLKKKSTVYGVKPSFNICIPRWRSTFIFDTMKEWDVYPWGPGMTLQQLAEILQVGISKTAHASQVFKWYREGTVESHERLAEYALRDVEITREVFGRLIFEKGPAGAT